MNSFTIKYLPTVIGLISIPIIVPVIDIFVDVLFDNTFRKFWKPQFHSYIEEHDLRYLIFNEFFRRVY